MAAAIHPVIACCGTNAVVRNANGRKSIDVTLTAVGLPVRNATALDVGFCFDACHTYAAGEDLVEAVARVQAAVGRIDLVHANDSRDPAGSGRDRHESLARGEIPPDALAAAITAADAPVICDTPGDVDDHLADLAWLREHVAPAVDSSAARADRSSGWRWRPLFATMTT